MQGLHAQPTLWWSTRIPGAALSIIFHHALDPPSKLSAAGSMSSKACKAEENE